MPLNELERHPFLNYLQEDNVPLLPDYKGLIIGSFPVYSCTQTLDNNLNVAIQRFNPDKVTMKFFYCSKKSSFWKYCAAAFNEEDPTLPQQGDIPNQRYELARQRSIGFLQRHKLLITDVLRQTNRKNQSDLDSDLWCMNNAAPFVAQNMELNLGIIELLNNNPTIKNLYFTATGINGKSPFGWFRAIFNHNLIIHNEVIFAGRYWSLTCTILGRRYNVFFLPTPKARGIHFSDNQRLVTFENFLDNHHNVFYQEISPVLKAQRTDLQNELLSLRRKEFLIECYRQALVRHNGAFNGIINNL